MKSKAKDKSKYAAWIDPHEVKPYEKNAKIHDKKQVKNIVNSIRRFGWQQDVVITSDKVLVIGHGRRLAALELGCEMPYHMIDKTADELTDADIRELRIADNQTNAETGLDFDILNGEILDLDFEGFDFDFGQPQEKDEEEAEIVPLAERFIVPPFDIFNARGGAWIKRKRAWNKMINDKAQARADAKPFNTTADYMLGKMNSQTSILDPVLSEIVCKWFSPAGGRCFDCFAGDTVFGYVSAYLGHPFTGIELRQEQVDFNNAAVSGLPAEYICDDGRNVCKHIGPETQDLLFSCPPYFDLEVYSDLPDDASNQKTYEDFYAILDTAFTGAIKCLKNNRFAVVVVGDVRDNKTGGYYNFPGDIINTFVKNGMTLYNNIKLLTPIGTAAIRAAGYISVRKVAHVYQDVLVFYKGDQKAIKTEFGEVEVADVSEDMEL